MKKFSCPLRTQNDVSETAVRVQTLETQESLAVLAVETVLLSMSWTVVHLFLNERDKKTN